MAGVILGSEEEPVLLDLLEEDEAGDEDELSSCLRSRTAAEAPVMASAERIVAALNRMVRRRMVGRWERQEEPSDQSSFICPRQGEASPRADWDHGSVRADTEPPFVILSRCLERLAPLSVSNTIPEVTEGTKLEANP